MVYFRWITNLFHVCFYMFCITHGDSKTNGYYKKEKETKLRWKWDSYNSNLMSWCEVLNKSFSCSQCRTILNQDEMMWRRCGNEARRLPQRKDFRNVWAELPSNGRMSVAQVSHPDLGHTISSLWKRTATFVEHNRYHPAELYLSPTLLWAYEHYSVPKIVSKDPKDSLNTISSYEERTVDDFITASALSWTLLGWIRGV